MTHEESTAVPAAGRRDTPRSPARITDVAARAGVSIKTVSRVVNDEKGVLPGTRDRVLAAVGELGFVPDLSARALKRGGHDAIGIVIDAIADPFFASFTSVIEELAVERGLSVVFASTGYDAAREREQLARLAGHRLRGLIIAPVAASSPELAALRRSFPVVCVDRAREGIDSVVVDDFGAAAEATRSFLARGHRRIAFIGEDTPYPTVAARLEGFRAAMAGAGLPVDESLVVAQPRSRSMTGEASAALLERVDAPTAVLCGSSPASIATIHAVRLRGLAMPALISFGDFALADLLSPGISCVDQDPEPIGEATFRRLLELMADPDAAPQHILVPTRLIHRGSGELPPRTAAPLASIGATR